LAETYQRRLGSASSRAARSAAITPNSIRLCLWAITRSFRRRPPTRACRCGSWP